MNGTGKLVAVTLIAMTIVAVFLAPLSTVVADNTGTVGVGNESATIHTDQWTDLDGYDITSNFTLETSSGTTLSEGTDYELNSSDGSIKALSGSTNVADGDTVYATYEYQASDSTTTTVAGLVPLFAGLLIIGTVAMRLRQMM